MDETQTTFRWLVLGVLLIMAAALAGQLWGDYRRALALTDTAERLTADQTVQAATLAASSVASPQTTPEGTRHRAATAVPQLTATAQAQRNWAAEAALWPVVWADDFSGTGSPVRWSEGGGDDALSTGVRAVRDGEYVWDLTAVQGFTWVEAPAGANPDLDDFFVSADLAMARPFAGDLYIAFRYVDVRNYYLAGLCREQTQVRVRARVDGVWNSVINCAPLPPAVPAAAAGAGQTVGVVGRDDQFALFINGVYVAGFSDGRLPRGRIGVLVDMNAGDVNTFRFDNFVVRAPR